MQMGTISLDRHTGHWHCSNDEKARAKHYHRAQYVAHSLNSYYYTDSSFADYPLDSEKTAMAYFTELQQMWQVPHAQK